MKLEILSFKEIEKNNLLPKFSPIFLIAKELKLKYLIKENNLFTGPAVGLTTLIDKITSKFKIKNILDLCCGTGALTKIALMNGVKEAVCLDLNLKAAKTNLSEFKDKVKFVKADVLKFKPKKFYDLIVFDGSRELVEKMLRKSLSKFKNSCNLFVLWHGSCEEFEWNEWVRNKLRDTFAKIMGIGSYGEEITCCSSTKKGKKWLEELFKIW